VSTNIRVWEIPSTAAPVEKSLALIGSDWVPIATQRQVFSNEFEWGAPLKQFFLELGIAVKLLKSEPGGKSSGKYLPRSGTYEWSLSLQDLETVRKMLLLSQSWLKRFARSLIFLETSEK
jgi:hypothetical protein